MNMSFGRREGFIGVADMTTIGFEEVLENIDEGVTGSSGSGAVSGAFENVKEDVMGSIGAAGSEVVCRGVAGDVAGASGSNTVIGVARGVAGASFELIENSNFFAWWSSMC